MNAVRLPPRLLRGAWLGLALLLAGCVATEQTAPAAATASAATVNDRLYFGRTIPTGGAVTDAQWKAFVADTIVPRFPQGFTVYHGEGHWKGDDGASVDEATCIVELTHPADEASERAIDEIATAYRRRFAQEAVLRVRTPAEMKFYRK